VIEKDEMAANKKKKKKKKKRKRMKVGKGPLTCIVK
jgi:hypothetical protein